MSGRGCDGGRPKDFIFTTGAVSGGLSTDDLNVTDTLFEVSEANVRPYVIESVNR